MCSPEPRPSVHFFAASVQFVPGCVQFVRDPPISPEQGAKAREPRFSPGRGAQGARKGRTEGCAEEHQASASSDMISTLEVSGSVWERAPRAGGKRGHDVHIRHQAIVAPHQEFLVLKQAEIATDGLLPKPSVDQVDYSIGR